MRSLSVFSLSWFVAISLLSGCQTLFRAFDKSTANARAGIVRAKKFTGAQGTMYWSHFDATKRSALINAKQNGEITVLAEVTPDAAVQKTLEILAKAKAGEKVDAETQLKTASTIAQLGQRTANVNMLRDALYRLAEGANNNPGFFYFFGSPVPAPAAATGAPAAPAVTPTLGNANVTPTNNPIGGSAASATCSTCATTYERLFTLTLSTYGAAVAAEAAATKAQAEAEKAKAEAETKKAELELKKLSIAPTDTTKKPKTPVVTPTDTAGTKKTKTTAKTKAASNH